MGILGSGAELSPLSSEEEGPLSTAPFVTDGDVEVLDETVLLAESLFLLREIQKLYSLL